jgi:hypothetical protein
MVRALTLKSSPIPAKANIDFRNHSKTPGQDLKVSRMDKKGMNGSEKYRHIPLITRTKKNNLHMIRRFGRISPL